MALPESIRFLGVTFSWTLRAGCLLHVLHENVYEFSETRGESMLPTLHNQYDYVHVWKMGHKAGDNLDMGDLVVAIKPSDPEHRVCKRITGMPGDIIAIDPSSSSELTNSSAIATQHDGYNKLIKVPKGHVWCTGDNLCHSLDSRSYSVMPMALIKGKIVAANSMNKGFFSGEYSFWSFRWLANNFVVER
ncbi:uncharacterized protein KQ657_002183 [Scheffersomyces spartinae]|uniref:Mitochondrial inner membrane protease subunit n=1 Tax=Scheffersomyces spartinae TaxID=45513 RepID=A0A9P8AKF7_9ASCO|nr:uncharacterized protein KQ657_002183 [Scheffersomyces spartinae]KAG7195798.1 hypothetical protein KQ657_002183 [Scheffersomyces spartinae]